MIEKFIKCLKIAIVVLILQIAYLILLELIVNSNYDASSKNIITVIFISAVPIVIFLISWIILVNKEEKMTKEDIKNDIIEPILSEKINQEREVRDEIKEDLNNIKYEINTIKDKIARMPDEDLLLKNVEKKLEDKQKDMIKEGYFTGSKKEKDISSGITDRPVIVERIDVVADKNNPDRIRKQDASDHFQIIRYSNANKYFLTVKDNVVRNLDLNDYHTSSEIKKFFKISTGGNLRVKSKPEVEQWNGQTGIVYERGYIG
jgi:hypothetical protein